MVDKKEIEKNIKRRDKVDVEGGNFLKPENAVEIDTSHRTLDEVYTIMINEIKNKI